MVRSVTLPPVVMDFDLPSLLAALSLPPRITAVDIDFQRIKYYIPAAVVSVMAAIRRWKSDGKEVTFMNLKECDALRYLQRMDFFSTLGFQIPEDFRRHDPGGDFLPVREIERGSQFPVEATAIEFARCIAPNHPDLRSLLQYGTSELILNVIQHADGTGYVAAQYSPKLDMARIGIADCGIGLLDSFRLSGSQFYFEGMTDAEAIEKALAPEVSSKTHLPDSPNRGVGLAIVRKLMERSFGRMVIASGSSWWYQDGTRSPVIGKFAPRIYLHGTLVSAGFQRDQIHMFYEMMREVRISLGLQAAETFESFFS
jgi:anti-sigma regulatory factor (Ser/Thr protein kinase)